MGSELKGKLEVTPEISLNVELNAQHLVDMQVSLTEEQLYQAEEKFIADIKQLDDTIREKTDARRALLDKAAESVEKALVKEVTPVLKKIGAASINSSRTWREGSAGKRAKPTLDIDIEIHPDSGRKKNTIGGELTFGRSIPVPAAATKLGSEIEGLQKEREAVRKKLEKVKVDLSNVPRIERKARAALAMKTLESTPAGRRLATDLQKRALLPPPK